jgi:hypothetical protein
MKTETKTLLKMARLAILAGLENEKWHYGEKAEWVCIPKCQAEELVRLITSTLGEKQK